MIRPAAADIKRDLPIETVEGAKMEKGQIHQGNGKETELSVDLRLDKASNENPPHSSKERARQIPAGKSAY